jgi:fluoroacetyl-CoA thioesterase
VRSSLKPGIGHEKRFRVPPEKMVPALYPESPEFQEMPEVFATGFMVGLLEWACVEALETHLDWPREQTLGTHVDVSHLAATPPGFEVVVKVRLIEVDGRRLLFEVEAHDGVDLITKGTHQRAVIDRGRFDRRMEEKLARPAER